MKYKAIFLLLIFSASLLPLNIAYAEAVPQRTLYDALNLMYISDSILDNQTDLDQVRSSPGLLTLNFNVPGADPDNAALAAAIHAAKAERNDLDAKCSLSVSQLRAQGKDCEADRMKATCDQRKQAINAKIGKLHDLRGDRRRAPTKIWHWLKRSGQGIWYRIGPVGRNFLRQVGPEALKIVASGGSLSLDVAKNLLKHTAKSMLRDRIRPAMLHGIERLLQGQIEIAQAAGVDICDPEEELKSSTAEKQGEISQENILKLTLTTEEIDFSWHSLLEPEDSFHSCGSLWPDIEDLFDQITFEIQIDPQNKTLSSETIKGNRTIEHPIEYRNSLQHQSFVVKLDGPYQVSEPNEDVLLILKGNTKLSMTLDAERECHYWEVPDVGDPVLIVYPINRIQTIDFNTPYEMRIVTYDGKTGELYLTIGNELESWGKNTGFLIRTLGHTISTEEMQTIWPE